MYLSGSNQYGEFEGAASLEIDRLGEILPALDLQGHIVSIYEPIC
uniref:Uncharacterized protein n=1 Tax=viral metagenome TaxID=1070528 RepID=A0A6C0BLQ1_9ZZZZ